MIRLFEEQVNDLYTRALMPGLAHLYIGEEAVAVGFASPPARRYITSTHRGHGHCLAKAHLSIDVRGAARQGSRLLQRQGGSMISPILTPAIWARMPSSGQHRYRHRGGVFRQALSYGTSLGLLLR